MSYQFFVVVGNLIRFAHSVFIVILGERKTAVPHYPCIYTHPVVVIIYLIEKPDTPSCLRKNLVPLLVSCFPFHYEAISTGWPINISQMRHKILLKMKTAVTTFILFQLRITVHFISMDLVTSCNLCYCSDNEKKKCNFSGI